MGLGCLSRPVLISGLIVSLGLDIRHQNSQTLDPALSARGDRSSIWLF